MNIGIGILLLLIILIIWSAIEQEFLVVTNYTVSSARLQKDMDGTGFVVLADLHNMNFGRNNRRLAARIDKLSPEFILVAGDLIDKNSTCYPGNAYKLLEYLAGKYKIYYAYGNHEQKLELYASDEWPEQKKKLYASWIEFKDRLEKLNVEFLDNSSTLYCRNNSKLCISGVSIGQEYFQKSGIPVMKKEYLTSLLGNTNSNYFQLLIAHNPVYFYDYASWGADLTVSGHLHGGMVRLPGIGGVISPQVKLFPKYHSGNFTENGQEMIVSRGLGTHSHMPRLFNVPEIVYIKLKNKA
jgi:predicted MPP superfamily phosphohydrolase